MKKVALLFYPDSWKLFTRLGFMLLLGLSTTLAAQAQDVVRGKVNDEAGNGMPGVNVIVKGTTNGTTSDADGQYAVTLPSGATDVVLVFSFIGYASQEIAVNGQTTVNVDMQPSLESLGEVVVV